MSYITRLTTVLLLLLLAPPSAFAAYGYYRAVDIDSVGSTLTDFTITVCFNGSAPCNATVSGLNQTGGGEHVTQADGDDIAFGSDNTCNTKLKWVLVRYVAATGELEAKVKVTLGTSVTTIYMCYGDAGVTTFQGGSQGDAFDTNTKAFFPFPDGTTLDVSDFSVSNADGTKVNTPTATAGKLDGGIEFDNSADQYVTLGNPAALQITGDLTICVSFNLTGSGDGNSGIIFSKDKDTGGRAYTMDLEATVPRFYYNGGGAGDTITSSTNVTAGVWYRICSVFDSVASNMSTIHLYIDGSDAATPVSGAPTSIPSATANVLIGRREYSGFEQPADAKMDDLVVATSPRSADWISADYAAFFTPGSFIAIGNENSVAVTTVRGGITLRGVQ